MKKIAMFLAFIVGIVSILFAGCGGNSNIIRLNEVTHSIFYSPFYAAINLGYFEDEGIKIELTNGGGSDISMTALLSRTADMALLGPETAVYVVSGDAQNAPVIFGQLTKRDGSFLVGRVEEPNFRWSNLANKEIIGGRRGGSPAMSLQYAVELAGLTVGTGVGETNINLDVSFTLVVSAFEAGQGDYCTMFEPVASQYVAAGKGYIVASVGEQSGEVPFTCFMALENYIKTNPTKVEGFLRAVSRAYNYLIKANDEQIVAALKPSFSTTADSLIISSVRNYIEIDAWKSTPVMSQSEYQRLLTIMINSGELEEEDAPTFADVVNNTWAENVMRDMS